MSHSPGCVRLRDPLVLVAALRETGYPEVEVHDSPQILHGFANQTAGR